MLIAHVYDDDDEREKRNLSDTRAHDQRKLGNGVHIIVNTFVRQFFKITYIRSIQVNFSILILIWTI